jgi:hypothetical protein
MTQQEAIAITSGLATFFDRKAWSAEKIRFFAQAIEDLPYESARQAAERYMREGEFSPVPRDIREIARTIEPQRKLLPGKLDKDGWPIRYYPEGGTPYVRCTPEERRTLDRQYARMRAETVKALAAQRARGVQSPMRAELDAAMRRLLAHGSDDEVPF